MSEQDVVIQLRSIAEPPIEPSQGFANGLWRLIESEMGSVGSPSLLTKPTSDGGTSVDVSVVPSIKRSRRNPAWAAAAAFALVLGTGLLVGWLLLPGSNHVADSDQSNAAFTAPGPVDLSAGDVLWPAQDMPGTPTSVAEVFAVEVLGWNRAAATEIERGTCLTFPGQDTEVCPIDATTVTLAQDGVDRLQLVLYTIGQSDTGQLWAVAQVGSGYATDRLEPVEPGTRIPLPRVEQAVEADITMRLANVDDLVEVKAAVAEFEAGYVDTGLVSDPGEVLSVLIRYRDAAGHVMTATGGPWNEFYEWPQPEPAGPEAMIAEGTYDGSTVGWRMSAFNTTEGNLCIRLSGMGCVTGMQSADHLGALLTSSSFDAGEEARWCAYGTVRDAEAVQLRLPDGTERVAPIFTSPDFDVDFFAYCSLGDQPASEVSALDSAGNVIDVVPDTRN